MSTNNITYISENNYKQWSALATEDVMMILSDVLDGDPGNRIALYTQQELKDRLQEFFETEVYYPEQ